MKNNYLCVNLSGFLLLCVIFSLVAVSGCGDDTVRGAGSIDVPRPVRKVGHENHAARRGTTASLPSGAG